MLRKYIRSYISHWSRVRPRYVHAPIVDETGKILGAQQRAKRTKMHPKRRSVKLTTVELPFLCFAVERRIKNKFCLLLTEKDSSLKFLLRKENVPWVVCTHPFEWTATNNRDLSRRRYLTSTFAPAASIFFFISSASSFVTPSLIVFGAPSTSAFASAKPSPGTAPRTSLITAILFAPISFKITSNVVFSSAAGAAAPPAAPPAAEPAATATGAAALTPHFSSSCLTNPAISSTDRLLSCSTNLSVSAIFISSNCRFRKLSEN